MLSASHLLASVEHEPSAVDLLLPAWPELVAGIIAFALVFIFVRVKVWPAMNRTLEARQAAIGGKLAEAEESKAEVERLRTDFQRQVAEARSKADGIIEEARRTAEQVRTETLVKAQAEGESLLAKAREEASSEMARVLAEARLEVANLSVDLAEKVVGASLDRQTQLGLVERYIAELESK